MRDICLPLFLHFCAAWHAEMPARLKLDHGPVDGLEVRTSRVSANYSDHASGTACDLRYDILKADHQLHMTAEETAILRRILNRYTTADGHHVLANGYVWQVGAFADEMHTELSQAWDKKNGAKRNTTPADVAEVIKRLRIGLDGRSAPAPVTALIPPFVSNFTVGTTQTAQTKAIQKGLGITVDGKFGPITLAKVTSYQKSHPLLLLLPPTRAGIVNARTYKALARPI
jgi:peptidoglycan hydrolase-like protein with peptidoglycan-binding domain